MYLISTYLRARVNPKPTSTPCRMDSLVLNMFAILVLKTGIDYIRLDFNSIFTNQN
jgi:hypothetical protein